MNAIFIYRSGYICPPTLHTNVIKVGDNVYKCLDCGECWTQTINSPQIIEPEEIYEFYKDKVVLCNELKK